MTIYTNRVLHSIITMLIQNSVFFFVQKNFKKEKIKERARKCIAKLR